MKRLMLALALTAVAVSPMAADNENTASGTYVEARTAEVFAGGCVMNGEAGTAGRQAVLAWQIDKGGFDGVALDGLSVVAAVAADKNLGIVEMGGGRAHARAAVYVDARANAEQQTALVAMANQLSHGLLDTVVAVTPAPIAFSNDGHQLGVTAGDVALAVTKHIDHDLSCGGQQWFQPLSTVSDATIGIADRHQFSGASLGTKWSDPDKKSAFFGTFSY